MQIVLYLSNDRCYLDVDLTLPLKRWSQSTARNVRLPSQDCKPSIQHIGRLRRKQSNVWFYTSADSILKVVLSYFPYHGAFYRHIPRCFIPPISCYITRFEAYTNHPNSFQPTSHIAASAGQTACQTLSIDIITIDPATFRGFMLNRKLAALAGRRGVALELLYAPALSAGSVRRQLLLTALQVSNITNGKVTRG